MKIWYPIFIFETRNASNIIFWLLTGDCTLIKFLYQYFGDIFLTKIDVSQENLKILKAEILKSYRWLTFGQSRRSVQNVFKSWNTRIGKINERIYYWNIFSRTEYSNAIGILNVTHVNPVKITEIGKSKVQVLMKVVLNELLIYTV